MFNSSVPMAATAAAIGALANTLRLELVDLVLPAAAAFIGALTAGLLASAIKQYNGYPRISLTVPSIVIMVPGLYLYRAIYNFGIMSLTEAVSWFAAAAMIIIALPLGLILPYSHRPHIPVVAVRTKRDGVFWHKLRPLWSLEIISGSC